MEYDWQGVIAATPFPEPFSIDNGHKSANLGLVKHSSEKKRSAREANWETGRVHIFGAMFIFVPD